MVGPSLRIEFCKRSKVYPPLAAPEATRVQGSAFLLSHRPCQDYTSKDFAGDVALFPYPQIAISSTIALSKLTNQLGSIDLTLNP